MENVAARIPLYITLASRMNDQTSSRRVLIVDDEEVIADTLKLILRMHGYDAASVYNAEEAVAWCRAHRPDFLITDVVMGAMNGIELAHYVVSLYCDCKPLLISGNTLTESLLAGFATSGKSFPILPKPVHPETILGFLATLRIAEIDRVPLARGTQAERARL